MKYTDSGLHIAITKMIATILPGSTNFHAVGYNEHKVSTGSARRIEMKNFGALGMLEPPTSAELTEFLQGYSNQNKRITKAQFHVAFSCKGHEMTEQEILDFAHEWLKEMGYMEPGQPLLVYAHNDTDNTHLHIITSRVAPDGKKIDHDHERRRSQEIVDRLMKVNREDKINKDLENIKKYNFNTPAQFKAILSSMGYEVYYKEDKYYLKYGGRIRKVLDGEQVAGWFSQRKIEPARRKQLRQILCKYRDLSTNKEELKKTLKEKFGIDLIFFGKKDHPFGYMLIDHTATTVMNGNRILALDRFLDFATPDQRFDRIETFIDDYLRLLPTVSKSTLLYELRKQNAYLKKDEIHYNGMTRKLKPGIMEQLSRNHRLDWIASFRPRTKSEVEMLCNIGKISEEDRKLVGEAVESNPNRSDAIVKIKEICNDPSILNLKSALHSAGFIIRLTDHETFAIDFSNKIIINLTEEGMDIQEIQRLHREQHYEEIKKTHLTRQQKQPTGNPQSKRPNVPKDAGGGSTYQKREWEVGNNEDYDRIDDANTLRM